MFLQGCSYLIVCSFFFESGTKANRVSGTEQPAIGRETGKPCGLSLQVRYGPPTSSIYLYSFRVVLVVKNESGCLQRPSDMLNNCDRMVNTGVYLSYGY